MKNDQMFRRYMAMLGEVYDKKITKVLTSAYWEILKNYEDQDVEAAFKDVLLTCKFFPRPAELVERIRGNEDHGDQALTAWSRVMLALESVGPHLDPKFDPTTSAAVRAMGGWQYLCGLDYSELKWQEKRFREHYEAAQGQGDHVRLPGKKVLQLADKLNQGGIR